MAGTVSGGNTHGRIFRGESTGGEYIGPPSGGSLREKAHHTTRPEKTRRRILATVSKVTVVVLTQLRFAKSYAWTYHVTSRETGGKFITHVHCVSR